MTKSKQTQKEKTLVLIDGHAYLFQSFHAIQNLTDPQGRPVNAIFGVINMLFRILDLFPCTHLAFVFDAEGPTFRHKMYPEYKANRGEMDESLREQIPRLHDLLKKMNFPVVFKKGFECDDLVGTFSKQAIKKGFKVVMVSDDKDFAQLIEKDIIQYKNRKDQIYDLEALQNDLGLKPSQIIDYLALMGDSSDNVPGIPGIGPKTALSFLHEYGSIKELYLHLDEIKGKKKQNLEDHKDLLELSRDLVTIDTNVKHDIDIENDFIRKNWDEGIVADTFRDLGFKRFLDRLNLNDKGQEHDSSKISIKRNYQTIDSEKKLKDLLKKISPYSSLAIDTETTGFNPYVDRLVGISLSWAPGEAAYIVIESPEDGIPLEILQPLLTPFLQQNNTTWIGHHLKFDAAFLSASGMSLGSLWQDTLLIAFALDSSNRRLKLDEMAWDLLGEKMIPIKDLIGTGKKAITMDQVPLEKVGEYASEDADITLRLYHRLIQDIPKTDPRLEKHHEQEILLSQILLKMENHGVRVDQKYLEDLSQKSETDLKTIENKIYKSVGHEFNIASPKQLSEVLFEELKLPVIKKTKTGYSTDSSVLKKLAPMHEVPELIEDHRLLSKLKSTYIDALMELTDSEGILHTTFSQTAAITGRLSSNRPNLQNIPIRHPRGRAIRGAFLPRKNNRFLSADYSQIELRLMAHFSQDPELCKAFEEGMDIHRFVAAQVNHIEIEDVSEDQRAAAKAVNFGILYGQGAFGLSEQLRITQKEAKKFIEQYFERFNTIKTFIQEIIDQARQNGYVDTIGGHRRPIKEFQSSNQMQQKMAERIAVNTLMQGSAADLIKMAMIRIDYWLQNNQPETFMVLQIHDELLFDVSSKNEDQLKKNLTPLMTDDMNLKVPLEISLHSGSTWFEAK